MIDLSNLDKCKIDIKSSKGNQPKWKIDDLYYKQDYLGYEGLVEYIVSELLKKSNLDRNEFVEYKIDTIKNGNNVRNGCVSKNFLKENENLITLVKLYRNNYSQRLINQDVYKIEDLVERVKFIDNRVYDLTGINNFGVYFCKMMEIDMFFLNEDRHFNNIALLYENENYKLCPIFDNGSGLLSDTTYDYPMNEDIYFLIDQSKPKTFSDDFYQQVETVEKLYGQQVEFYFNKNDIKNILDKEPFYDKKIKERVKIVLYEQMRKYGYLFK